MKLKIRQSFLLNVFIFLTVFLLLIGIFSLKTMYYFANRELQWWLYVSFILMVYSFVVIKYVNFKRPVLVVFVASVLIAYIPFEVTVGAMYEYFFPNTDSGYVVEYSTPPVVGLFLYYIGIPAIIYLLLKLVVKTTHREKIKDIQ